MKFCQPSASQSKSTHTRPSSLGSRKACEPLDPCCFRFSRLVVEKTLHQRSKSSTFVVAKNNCLLLCGKRRRPLRHSPRSAEHATVRPHGDEINSGNHTFTASCGRRGHLSRVRVLPGVLAAGARR